MTTEKRDVENTDISLFSEKEKQELITSAASISSSTTAVSSMEPSDFVAGKSLSINTKGIPILRFPFPSSELEIGVYNPDGSIAYVSTREKRSSGSCVLSDAQQKPLVSTTYFFGPGRDPKLHLLGSGVDENANEIKATSKWTSRSQKFVMPDGRVFEWTYKREKGTDGKKATNLVLYRRDGLQKGGKRIAQLVRNEETRTPGSKSCSAGNGGELVLSQDAADAMSEGIVVATCMLMLKKEIDRRRAMQMMVLSMAISSGT